MKRRRRMEVPTVALVALMGCAQPEFPIEAFNPHPPICLVGEDETPPGPIGVTLVGADRPVNRTRSHRIIVRTTNRAAVLATVDLETLALAGGRTFTHRTSLTLDPSSTADTPVSLEDLGIDRTDLSSSGTIRVRAAARLGSDADQHLGADLSAERYFHIDEQTNEFVDYDKTTLVEQFQRGDFAGRVPARERGAGVEEVAVLSVPRGSR